VGEVAVAGERRGEEERRRIEELSQRPGYGQGIEEERL